MAWFSAADDLFPFSCWLNWWWYFWPRQSESKRGLPGKLLFLAHPPAALSSSVWTQDDSDSLLQSFTTCWQGKHFGIQRLRLTDTSQSHMSPPVSNQGDGNDLTSHCCMTDSHQSAEFQCQIAAVANTEYCDSAFRSHHQPPTLQAFLHRCELCLQGPSRESESIGKDF